MSKKKRMAQRKTHKNKYSQFSKAESVRAQLEKGQRLAEPAPAKSVSLVGHGPLTWNPVTQKYERYYDSTRHRISEGSYYLDFRRGYDLS